MTKIITKTKNGEKWTGRFVSNAAINRERNSIKGLFSYITDTLELLENNPTKKWKPLPIIEKIKPSLEIEQEQAILKLASSDIGFFTELVFLDTLGARKSEMYNLLWKHTHLESTKYFPYGYADLVNRKNGKVLRVPFSAELQTLLQNMPRCSEYVFANPKTGTRYTHRYKKLKTILEKVGVDGLGIGYHIFRHNTAANLEQNGVEASVISEILGNTSGVVRTTYLNQGIKRKQEVINLNSERIRKLTTRREKIKSVHKMSTTQII
jgi:integrase